MNGHYSDFEELRPTGEASHIPDTRLEDGCEGEPRQQRVATNSGGYPDAPTVTDVECRSCGASVPDGQTKCRFCLTNHLRSDATSTDETASTAFLGIVHDDFEVNEARENGLPDYDGGIVTHQFLRELADYVAIGTEQ